MKTKIILFSLLALFLNGCSQVALDITSYTPLEKTGDPIPSFVKGIALYPLYSDVGLEVAANIYEFNNIMTLFLAIKNETDRDIAAGSYSIFVSDGRDNKELKRLSRQDMLNIKMKYTGTPGGAIQDQVINVTMSNAMKVANVPTKEKLAELIGLMADNYFSFRPIYARETRQGILCFMPDFKLEYPLTITLRMPSGDKNFVFLPNS